MSKSAVTTRRIASVTCGVRRLSDGFPINTHWQLPDGTMKQVWATPGENLLDVAIDNGIDEDQQGMFGMCGGACCCSTCHVILDPAVYDNMTEVTEDEEDLLDYVKGLTETSRLACQLYVHESMKDTVIELPPEVVDLR